MTFPDPLLAVFGVALVFIAAWIMPNIHFWWARRKEQREMDAVVRVQEESRKRKKLL